jgi:hypothetical protein
MMVFTTGCTDWLDTKPESEIILDEYWKKEADVEAVVASSYKALTEGTVISRMIVWGELRSDNLVSVGNVVELNLYKILQGNITPTNIYTSWSAFYQVINYCNTVLKYAPVVCERDENFTQADLAQAKSEVLSIRALAYFYLVRSFRDVPWMSEASVSDNQEYNVKLSTEDEILTTIIKDLKYAEQNITEDYGKTNYNKGRFTKSSVQALLADIYLWKNEYQNCIDECDKVMNNKSLNLLPARNAYTQLFYFGNSTESIFELQFKDNVQENYTINNFYGTVSFSGLLSYPTTMSYNPYSGKAGAFSPFLYKVTPNFTESEKDIRAKDSYTETNQIFKYVGVTRVDNGTGDKGVYAYRTNTSNWIVYRLSDVMLMKAEALVELDSVPYFKSALSLVNKTYLRSNEGQDSLSLSNYSNQSDLRLLVLRERQRELLFEGKRWFDLVRMARRENSTQNLSNYVDRKSSGNSVSLGVPVIDALFMPISRSELQANPNLKQNKYYSTNEN